LILEDSVNDLRHFGGECLPFSLPRGRIAANLAALNLLAAASYVRRRLFGYRILSATVVDVCPVQDFATYSSSVLPRMRVLAVRRNPRVPPASRFPARRAVCRRAGPPRLPSIDRERRPRSVGAALSAGRVFDASPAADSVRLSTTGDCDRGEQDNGGKATSDRTGIFSTWLVLGIA
jgi:hypothetical protein